MKNNAVWHEISRAVNSISQMPSGVELWHKFNRGGMPALSALSWAMEGPVIDRNRLALDGASNGAERDQKS